MKTRYHVVTGIAQVETAGENGAVCLKDAQFNLGEGEVAIAGDHWFPKATLTEDSLDEVSEAVRGDEIEIYVAEDFLQKV